MTICRTQANPGQAKEYSGVRAAHGKAQSAARRLALASLALLCLAVPTQAQIGAEEVQIRPLTDLDQQYMEEQRELIDTLARRHLGSACCDRAEDLPLLQRLLDEDWVQPDQRR